MYESSYASLGPSERVMRGRVFMVVDLLRTFKPYTYTGTIMINHGRETVLGYGRGTR